MKSKVIRKALSVLCALIVLTSGISAFSFDSPPLTEIGTIVNDGYDIKYINPDGTEYSRHLDEIKAVNTQDNTPSQDGEIFFYSQPNVKSSSTVYPSSFNLNDVNGKSYITRPECQYNGDCWTFATMSTLESSVMMQGYDEPHFSKSHLAYFSYNPQNEGAHVDDPFNEGGNYYLSASTLMNLEGIANKSDYPNAFDSNVTYTEADRFNHESGYVLDEVVELKTTDEVKEWLMENGAVFSSYYLTETHRPDSVDLPVQYNQVQSTNHAITIIGWDDTIPASAFAHNDYGLNSDGAYERMSICPSRDGAWIVKNTTGLNYNGVRQEYYDDNIMYISYDQYFSAFAGLKAKPDTDIYNHYTYTERSAYAYFYMTNPEYGNVYVAEGNEKISEIGFNLDTLNQLTSVTVTVKIYKNLPSNYSNPASGTLAATFSKVYTNDGFYTFDLPEEVSVSAGEIYSVMISCVDSGGCDIHIPCERNYDDVTYTGAAKQSYYKSNGRYYDIYTYYRAYDMYNIFMHVYTKCDHTETQTQDGNQMVTVCSQCGKEFGKSCITHTYGDDIIIEEASCTGMGIISRTCTLCGAEDFVTTPPSGHSYGSETRSRIRDDVNIKDYYKTCTICGNETVIHSDVTSTKTITLAELIKLIFDRIFSIFL